jgi:hypothetical protein
MTAAHEQTTAGLPKPDQAALSGIEKEFASSPDQAKAYEKLFSEWTRLGLNQLNADRGRQQSFINELDRSGVLHLAGLQRVNELAKRGGIVTQDDLTDRSNSDNNPLMAAVDRTAAADFPKYGPVTDQTSSRPYEDAPAVTALQRRVVEGRDIEDLARALIAPTRMASAPGRPPGVTDTLLDKLKDEQTGLVSRDSINGSLLRSDVYLTPDEIVRAKELRDKLYQGGAAVAELTNGTGKFSKDDLEQFLTFHPEKAKFIVDVAPPHRRGG